jgi:chromosome segregation ATPase
MDPNTSSDLDPRPDLDTPSDLDPAREAAEHQPADSDAELERLQAELAEALAEVARQRDRGDAAEEERDAARVGFAAATTERDTLRQERDRVREECVVAARRGDELALQLGKTSDERDALQLSLEQAERDRDQTQASLKSEVAAHAVTRLGFDTEHAKRVKLEEQLTHLREANAELETQLESANTSITSLRRNVSRWKALAGIGAFGTAANLIPRK